jgi:hypothetical protein
MFLCTNIPATSTVQLALQIHQRDNELVSEWVLKYKSCMGMGRHSTSNLFHGSTCDLPFT